MPDSSLALLLLLPGLSSCVGNVQRSARVPHPGVPLSSGQPLDGAAEASVGLSNLTDFVKPTVGDASQAVEVPSTQMRDELRLRVGKRGTVAAIYEQGFASTSKRPDSTQAPVGPGDVIGLGLSAGYSLATSTPGFSIGATVELMRWSVPYVEFETCTDCPVNVLNVQHGRADAMTLGLGITPSYRTGNLTLFGGAFARNHPTTGRKELNTTIGLPDNGDVQDGPLNVLLSIGAEIKLEKWLSALVVIHQDVTADPVQYGPGIGVAVVGRLGD